MGNPQTEPATEPTLTKAELKRREKLRRAEAKAEAKANKERAVQLQRFEKLQREKAEAEEKRRRDDPELAAAAEKETADDDWDIFSLQSGLALRVEEARDLAKGRATNPYVVVKYGVPNDDAELNAEVTYVEEFRTGTVKGNVANPAWREFFAFPECLESGRVDLEVWDNKFLGRDKPLGMIGLKPQQVMKLQRQSAAGSLDAWLYLQPLGSCARPTGSIRLIATMGDRKTKRKLRSSTKKPSHKHTAHGNQQFRSRKELSKVTAAAREAKLVARAKEEMEAYFLERDKRRNEEDAEEASAKESEKLRVKSVAEQEEREKQEAAVKLAQEQKEAQLAAEAAAQEEAELLLAEEQVAAEKAELEAAREDVVRLEKSLAEARETGNTEDEENLLRDLAKARQVEKDEQADYQEAEGRRAKEQMEADHAREILDQETKDVKVAEQAYAREAEEARVAAENLKATTSTEEQAKEITSSITTEGGEASQELEGTGTVPPRAEIRRKNNTSRILESRASRAARRNEEEAARGTDWERAQTAAGKRKWRDKQKQLAGTWGHGRAGSRLTPGLYSADQLNPRKPTPDIVRAREEKMAGRSARNIEYQRRKKAIAANYPTLAAPLEPDMAAWGQRAPPPFHPPPTKPRMAGKLMKWRPAALEHCGGEDAWRTRWVEVRVEAQERPSFETLTEEQQFIKTEIENDLRYLGRSQAEIAHILHSVKHPLRKRIADDEAVADLLFSAEAVDRRNRRRLRPVLSYRHSKGGRELGTLDLRGAMLTRSYRPSQAQQQYPTTRPLMPSDLRSAADETHASNFGRLHTLVGDGPRAALLKDLCRDCIQAGWESVDIDEVDLSSTRARVPHAACGRPFLTITTKDPHGGCPHIVPPDPTWEHLIKQLRRDVGGTSRLDATLALMESHGDHRLARARLGDAKCSPNLEDVAGLLQAATMLTTISATFSCDKTGTAAEEYLQKWYEQLRYACWETNLSTDRSPWETDKAPEQQPPPQTGPRSFDPPGGPQDGPMYKTKGHPAYYLPPPASLYAVRGKLRHELEVTAQRFVPFRGGLYRNMADEMEAAAVTKAAMQWRSGGKATNGGVRWAPGLEDRKTAVMKAFAPVSEGTASGKSVGEVAAEAA